MSRRNTLVSLLVCLGLTVTVAAAAEEAMRMPAPELSGTEVYTATAVVSPEKGKETSAAVTITISRLTTEDERQKVAATLKAEGASELRTLLSGMPEHGSIEFGGETHPIRFAYARNLGGGMRLITLGTDHPLVFVGADGTRTAPKEGYDFGLVDLTVEGSGKGEGSVAGAAKLKLGPEGGLVVDDFGGNKIRLTSVKKQAK